MKKALNVILFILVTLICIVTIISLPLYDRFISEKIFTPSKESQPDDPVLFSDNNYKGQSDSSPVFSIANNTIQLMYKGNFITILPDGYTVNSDAPADIFEILLTDGNFKFSEDGTKAAYMLTFNKINVLFFCNLETGEVVKIDDKVDSFSISPDGSYVVYATGYIYSNTVFVYKDGKIVYVAENVSALYSSRFDQIVLKTQDDCCSIYSITDEQIQILDTGVDSLCVPTSDGKFNYPLQYDTFSVFYNKGGHVYRFIADESVDGAVVSGNLAKLECDFEQAVPYKVFSSDSAVYRFFSLTGELVTEENGADKILYKDVVAVYLFDGNSRFVLATGKALILYDASSGSSETLLTFTARYKKCKDLIRNHISVNTNDYNTFYVCSLDDSSWIWKKKYPESWLNRFSKYRYSLNIISRSGEDTVVSEERFPSAVSLYDAVIPGENLFFVINDGKKDIVYKYDGASLTNCLEGDIKIMKNEDGIFCAQFDKENVTIYEIG